MGPFMSLLIFVGTRPRWLLEHIATVGIGAVVSWYCCKLPQVTLQQWLVLWKTLLKCYCNPKRTPSWSFLQWAVINPLPIWPPSWRTTPCQMAATICSMLLQLPSICRCFLLHPQPEDAMVKSIPFNMAWIVYMPQKLLVLNKLSDFHVISLNFEEDCINFLIAENKMFCF